MFDLESASKSGRRVVGVGCTELFSDAVINKRQLLRS